MRSLAIVLVVGCGGSSATTPVTNTPPKPVTGPQFLVEAKHALHFYTVTNGVVTRTREVRLPTSIATLAWSRKQPVLLLGDEVARVTDAGLEILPQPPLATFKYPTPISKATHEDTSQVRMFTKGDEVWVGKCEWWSEGGMYRICAHWVNARIDPAPVVTETEERWEMGEREIVGKPLHPVAAPTSIRAVLVPDQARHQGERDKLQCTDGAVTVEDPPADKPYERHGDTDGKGGRSDLVWLSTEPPIFQLADSDDCMFCPDTVIFERCKRSTRYNSGTFGPDDLILFSMTSWQGPVLHGNVIVFQHGRELATLEDVARGTFLPGQPR